ncbi:hypothetical protein HMPREF1981_00574 [Bacteroides pyogenes F0041]|uniref:Uncharacterized protein n=1 Tax=Bacteroides pyogenes F0041 TaxID=1321819 RepID=U2CWD7_9BACE|nr:hypothetical protein HMPREF1981_00574 [Bacteroides pyogenes F0041]
MLATALLSSHQNIDYVRQFESFKKQQFPFKKLFVFRLCFIRLPNGRRIKHRRKTNETRTADELLLL